MFEFLRKILTWFIWKTNEKELKELGKEVGSEVIWTDEDQQRLNSHLDALEALGRKQSDMEYKKLAAEEKKQEIQQQNELHKDVVDSAKEFLVKFGYSRFDVNQTMKSVRLSMPTADREQLIEACLLKLTKP